MKLRNFFSSFKARLLLLVTLAILLPLLAAGMIMGYILQQRIYASFENELRVALEIMDLLLVRWEEELSNDLDRLADDKDLETRMRVAEQRSMPADSLTKEKITAQRKILNIGWLALFDLDRQLVASSKFKSKKLSLDFSRPDHFQIGKSDSDYYLIFLAPVKQRGQVLGYLAGGSRLNDREVAAYLHEKNLKNFAFWLDGEPILTDLPQAFAALQQETMHDFNIGGKKYKGAAQGRRYGGHLLQYAALFPIAPLQRDLNKVVGSILAIVGALFLAFLILLAGLANRMTRPLHRLTNHARQLASNKFTPQSDEALTHLAAHSQDEIGKLAESFLQMERQLQVYLRDLAETERAQEKIQSELRIARHIQMSMLPRLTSGWAAGEPVEIAAAIEPAEQVGGDFYDFFMLDARHLCLVIGDVSDKGLPAALFMAVSKTLLHAVAAFSTTDSTTGIQPHEVLARVNRELSRDNDLFLFVTIFLGVLNIETGELQYTSAGHLPPYLLSAERGLLALNHQHRAPLGWKPETRYESARLTMHPGESLFCYTDGVIESMNAADELFSEARLAEFLKGHQHVTAAEMAKEALVETKRFAAPVPPHDDMTVLVVKYRNT
ncbi:MAG: PP2C family protein-serine/threonine phosphatase [bacterium]